MPEADEAAAAEGERRALFRLLAPGSGGHHYATLREQPAGPGRFTLEVRRGLVWGSTERVLLVTGEADPGGGLRLTAASGSGAAAAAGRVAGDDLQAFAARALGIAAERLGVDGGAFFAASHVDLGESGTLGVEASVRDRSAALLEASDVTSPMSLATEPAAEADAASPPPLAGHPPVRRQAPAAAADPAPVPGIPAEGAESAPDAHAPGSLLGRIVRWFRRATRAALGR